MERGRLCSEHTVKTLYTLHWWTMTPSEYNLRGVDGIMLVAGGVGSCSAGLIKHKV